MDAEKQDYEEEGRWVLMEDRRGRNVAFENLAKEMLRYLENSEDVKVSITELQEQLEVPDKISFTLQQVAQQQARKKGYEEPAGQGGMRRRKALWSWEEGVRTQVRKYTC